MWIRLLIFFFTLTHSNVIFSTGNGSFYYIEVESPDFSGKTTLECHKQVQGIIAKQIDHIHGFRIKTRAPKAKTL